MPKLAFSKSSTEPVKSSSLLSQYSESPSGWNAPRWMRKAPSRSG